MRLVSDVDAKRFVESSFNVALRPVQNSIFDTLDRTFYHSPVRVAVIAAPTGSGKSLIAEGSAEYLRSVHVVWKTWYVTPTIHLQLQYANDVKRFGLRRAVVLAGRSNYSCPYLSAKYGEKISGSAYTADDCIYLGPRSEGEECPYYLRPAPFETFKRPAELEAQLNEKGYYYDWFYINNKFVIRYFPTSDLSRTCPYFRARLLANTYEHVITNYDVVLTEWAGQPSLRIPNMLVFDEAHVLLDKLQSAYSSGINIFGLLKRFNIDYTDIISRYFSHGSCVSFVGSTATLIINFLLSVADVLNDRFHRSPMSDSIYVQLARAVNKVENIISLLNSYPRAFEKTKFCVRAGKLVLRADPVSLLAEILRRYFATTLVQPNGVFFGAPPDKRKALIMSGTVGGLKLWLTIMNRAGLAYNRDWIYIDMSEFGFPPEMRPVYYVPLYALTRANYVDFVDHFAALVASSLLTLKRLQDKGYYVRPAVVVHAYLRDAAKHIYDAVSNILSDYPYFRNKVFLAIADEEIAIRDIVNAFKREGGVLVSSTGVAEGVDFKDDIARLQFVFKAPFPGEYDPYLRDVYVAKTIVQMAGRVARSADDFGGTFIVDRYALEHFLSHVDDGIYPKYYRDAVRIFDNMSDAFNDYLMLFRQNVPILAKGDEILPEGGGSSV